VFVAVAGLLAVAARLLAISRFDVNTATTILERSGTATVAAGTALALLPFALVLVTCFLGVATFVDRRLLRLNDHYRAPLLALAIGATLCMTAIPLGLFTLSVVLFTAIVGRLNRNKAELDLGALLRSSRLLRAQVTALFVVMALAPIVLQQPWLPMQAVYTSDGRLLIGYVLGDADPQLALMNDEDRSIVFLTPAEVASREICSGPPSVGGLFRTAPQLQLSGSFLGALLWGDRVPHYPPCPAATN
jgi:hypothetical protein